MADTRSSALFKRAEQLKRWEESDTNRQSTVARRPSKIKFSSGCVFLAACASGDKEEVLRLLQTGADINTANVDGLTALHQACIDDNLDMVEFLVARGADVNRGDNEGWTPLHATASCGFISIARFLLESNADVAAVNYDGELPVDIAESETMEELLQKVIDEKGVDCEAARNAEVSSLLADARKWAAYGYVEMQDPKTGGTPLHVAAAKGYVDVANVLLEQCGVDPDCVDFDGWTPLHAAALWGQKEAAAALIKHGADIDLKNYSGQSCMDLVEPSLSAWLEEARAAAGRNNNNNNKHKHKRGPPPSRDPPLPNHKLKRVELQITNQPESILNDKKSNSTEIMPKVPDGKPPKGRAASPDTTNEQSNTEINANNTEEAPSWRRSASFRSRQNDATRDSKSISTNSTPTSDDTILRRTHSFENDKAFYQRYRDVTARIKASSCPSIPPPPAAPPTQPADTNRQSEPQANTNTDTNEGPQLRNNAGERREREANTWAAPASAAQVAVRRSFVPPVRDEESETQRKAHAKRVRETRRSTQGVTLDEIKSAEQLVKKKSNNDTTATVTTTVPVTTTTATLPLSKAEEKENSTFELEEVSGPGSPRSASPRLGSPAHPAADTTVTLPLRRTVTATTTTSASPTPAAHNDDKGDAEQTDKKSAEGSERGGSGGGAGSTQAALNVIQRRRRPKRRSTGVGHFDMDEIVNERGGSGEGDSEGDVSVSGSERTSDAGDATAASAGKGSRDAAAEGEKAPDYRALWEASQLEVRRLRDLLTTSEQQLRDSRGTIARLTQVNQNSLTELEKREKRAMERKLSEMEEELKFQQALQAENQRLRDENGALIRVISKLSK